MKPNSKRARLKLAQLKKRVKLANKRFDAANEKRYKAGIYRDRVYKQLQMEVQFQAKLREGGPLSPLEFRRVKRWCTEHRLPMKNGRVVLYKRVSVDFRTQENTNHETDYTPGTTVILKDWHPREREYGDGKLHACYNARECTQFRGSSSDKYIAISVALKDCYAWDGHTAYPEKIAFRKGKVLGQVSQYSQWKGKW